ncbi:hypothetical protein [Calothrix sp. NIES-2098]|uniref:hypothetical protein n=1 Tax=Calothrix sp. NIES-2098 TaxID=1954171 RepID=UPI0030D75718
MTLAFNPNVVINPYPDVGAIATSPITDVKSSDIQLALSVKSCFDTLSIYSNELLLKNAGVHKCQQLSLS